MLFHRIALVVAIVLWVASSPVGVAAQNARAVPVTPSGSLAEAREPQVAVSTSGSVYVTYGVKNALYCSVSNNGGQEYATPVKVGEAGVLALGMRRGPRIAVAGKTVVISAVYGGQGRGRDGDLLSWRSRDGGKTWEGPSRVNDVTGAAREGLHAMAASPDGALSCAWLDLRSKGTKIYASTSRDGGATWEPNTLVYQSPDGTVCECCHPSLAYDAGGKLYIMWRNWLGGSRDMYLARSDDGGKNFSAARKLGKGTWPLNACPMDGGAVSVGATGSLTTFWQRNGKMFECAPGGEERLVGVGVQGWAATGAKGVYLIWLKMRGGGLIVQVPGQSAEAISDAADDPVVASAPGGTGLVIVVWKAQSNGSHSIVSASLPTK